MEENKQISAFNDAVFQISRLHDKWTQINRLREGGRFNQVLALLDTIELELSWDTKKLDEDHDKDYIKKLKDINKEITKSFLSKNAYLKYIYLMKKERLLREIQNETGKGAKYRPEEEDSLD